MAGAYQAVNGLSAPFALSREASLRGANKNLLRLILYL